MKIEVKYNGAFPNLCSGDLAVIVDGVRYDFPNYCLCSGGAVWFDADWKEHVDSGPWSVSEWPEDFPKDYDLRVEVLDMINAKIPWGCCGGCV